MCTLFLEQRCTFCTVYHTLCFFRGELVNCGNVWEKVGIYLNARYRELGNIIKYPYLSLYGPTFKEILYNFSANFLRNLNTKREFPHFLPPNKLYLILNRISHIYTKVYMGLGRLTFPPVIID
jgi:hypothetical protein